MKIVFQSSVCILKLNNEIFVWTVVDGECVQDIHRAAYCVNWGTTTCRKYYIFNLSALKFFVFFCLLSHCVFQIKAFIQTVKIFDLANVFFYLLILFRLNTLSIC